MQWHAFVLLVYFTLSPLFNLRSLLHLPDPEPSVAEYQITKVQPTLVVRVEILCSSGRMGEPQSDTDRSMESCETFKWYETTKATK